MKRITKHERLLARLEKAWRTRYHANIEWLELHPEDIGSPQYRLALHRLGGSRINFKRTAARVLREAARGGK
jgi:hypothetical protein